MRFFCPCCSGPMQRYIGAFLEHIKYSPVRARQGEYVVCLACPVASEVDTRTGSLIDLGAVTLQDLLSPAEEPITLVVAAPQRLDGRTDS